MPLWKKKSAPKSKMIRRRRLARRPMRSFPLRKPNVYHFKRKLFLQDGISIPSTAPWSYAYQFRLMDLPNYTEYTALYDQYRINKIVLKLIPKYTESTVQAGATTNNAIMQQVHSAIDYDDLSYPTGISQLCEFQTHKMTRGNQVHTRVLVPQCQINVGNLGAAAPKAKQWLDCDQPGLSHRGVKVFIPNPTPANTTVYYDVEMTYYVSFKAVI